MTIVQTLVSRFIPATLSVMTVFGAQPLVAQRTRVSVPAPEGQPMTTSVSGRAPAPQNVQMIAGGSPALHVLRWDPLPGVAKYVVYRRNEATTWRWMEATGQTMQGDTFRDTNYVQPGAEYRVTAMYADGREGTTDFVYANPPQPQVPTGFFAGFSYVEQNGEAHDTPVVDIGLSWQPVPYAVAYRLFRIKNGIRYPPDGEVVHGTTRGMRTLMDESDYTWQITADYGIGIGYRTDNLPTVSIYR